MTRARLFYAMNTITIDSLATVLVSFRRNSIGLNNGLAPNRGQAIIWTHTDAVHWRIYAALKEYKLMGETCNTNFTILIH